MAAFAPNLKRKREHTDNDVSSDVTFPATPSSPTKRVKVATIDTANNSYHKIFKNPADKPYLLVREEVKRALSRADAGENESRDALVNLFSARPDDDYAPSEPLLLKSMEALATMANHLPRNPGLVTALLGMQWVGREAKFVQTYVRLLGNLVATHIGFLRPVLQSLVDRFTRTKASAGRLPGAELVKRPELQTRLHMAIGHVLDKAPSALSELQSVLRESFPFHTDSLRIHTDYVSNLLRVIAYEPTLRADILALIMDRLVKIDAQTQGDIEDIEEEFGPKMLEDVLASLEKSQGKSDVSTYDDASDSESEEESEWEEEEEVELAVQKVKELKQAIAKMDAIMELMFEYYEPLFGKGISALTDAAFEQMLGIFSQTILHTRNSRHTQFLLFHFSQTSPELVERFATDLTTWTFNTRRSALLRENAAMYLASLISRGAHVPQELTEDVVDILLHELERHRKLYEANCRDGPDLNRWPTYYFVAQALLYIFCFRWRDLTVDGNEVEDGDIADGHDLTWKTGLKEILTANIYSPLNPLKVCTGPIVDQFARIAHHLRFMYVFPLLETNRRRPFITAMVHDSISIRAERSYQLEAWFPFDPYHLPRSKRWLEGDYISFKNPPGMQDDEDDEEETDGSRVEEGVDEHVDEEELDDITDEEDRLPDY